MQGKIRETLKKDGDLVDAIFLTIVPNDERSEGGDGLARRSARGA